MPTILLVTIDTEEEFDWGKPLSPRNRSVEHAAQLPRLQELFEDIGARPTYVVDHPIAATDESLEVLSEFLARESCEIGAHLHPWVNPPIAEEISPKNTYLCNLPLSLQQEKVALLTETIESGFGTRPVTFKAGRYGLDFALVPFLQSQGYTADTSVISFTDLSADRGPCFADFDNYPFALTPPLVPETNGEAPLLEIPVTVGFSRRPFRWWSRVHRFLSQERFRRLRPVGIMWHLQILRKAMLTPEGTALRDLTRLLEAIGKDTEVVLNVTLHSPSIAPGNTPYVRTPEDLEQFLTRLRTTLEYAVHRLGARSMTLSEFTRWFMRTKGS